MTDPSRELFDNYQENHVRLTGKYFQSLAEVREFHLERIPRWFGRVAKDARILDAGFATGYQLGLLHEMGYQKLSGVELSEQLFNSARANLPDEISLYCSDVLEFLQSMPDASFDVILFHHVLEHIPRDMTLPLLREFRRCLAPDGLLTLRVPNASCLMHGSVCFGDFTHVVHFNEISLTQILEQAGFAVDKVEIILRPPQLFWSWKHPIRAGKRLLNRIRWHLNDMLHTLLGLLADVQPRLRCSERDIEILVSK